MVYLKRCNYFKNAFEENISQEFWMKKIDETKNYLFKKIEQSELKRKKYKKVCTTLNYIENVLILASRIPGSILFSTFVSLVGIPIWITSSAIGLRTCAITAEIKKYKSMIKKKKKKQDKIVLSANTKSSSI